MRDKPKFEPKKKIDPIITILKEIIKGCDKWLTRHPAPLLGDNNLSHDFLVEYTQYRVKKEVAMEILSGISTTSTT